MALPKPKHADRFTYADYLSWLDDFRLDVAAVFAGQEREKVC